MVLRLSLRYFSLLVTLFFFSAVLNAATVSGTVKDSTGAVIPHAQIEIRGNQLAQPLVTTSDGLGHFTSSDLAAGTYSVKVSAEGFEPLERSVVVAGDPVNSRTCIVAACG